MSLINQGNSGIDINAVNFALGMELAGEPEIGAGGRASMSLGITMLAAPSVVKAGNVSFQTGITVAALPRLNNEANVFESVSFQLGITAQAALSNLVGSFINFELGLAAQASPSIKKQPESSLRLNLTLLPANPAGNYQEIKTRLLLDGVELPIKSFSLDAPRDASGTRLEIGVSRISDRQLIQNASLFSFDIGVVQPDGSVVWKRYIDGGTLAALSHSIGWTGDAPSDTLSFSTLNALADRISKAPNNNLTIYDPFRVDPPTNTEDILTDTAGNLYPDQSQAVADLSLHTLMSMIFVGRCGFSGIKTNLPDYPIRQARFEVTAGWFSGVAPHIGQFDPLIFELAGEIWIIDATIALPNGFPAPRQLSVSRYKAASFAHQYQLTDGFILSYSESDVFDYFTQRIETDVDSSPDDVFDPTYTKTTTKRTFHDYRNNANPSVILKTDLIKEERTVTGTFGDVLGKTVMQRYFDGLGREQKTVKEIWNRVPDLPAGTDLTLKLVKTETYQVYYLQHPLEPRKQYIGKTERSVTGLIAVDSENKYLDENFEQDFAKAHEVGNLSSGMDVRSGAIEKITERIYPQPNGVVITETVREDLIRKLTSRSQTETKSGDVGISSQTSRQRRLIVLANDTAERSGKPLGTLAGGELPLELLIPLARRKQARGISGAAEPAVDFDGVDQSIDKGSTHTIIGRSGEQLGVLMVEGYRITGEELGTDSQMISTALQGVVIG